MHKSIESFTDPSGPHARVVAPFAPDPKRRKKWLADRRGGLGGSDAAVVLEEAEYEKSRYALFQEKTAAVEEDELTGNAVRFGHVFEPVILSLLAEKHPEREIYHWPQDESVQHETAYWMRCTPDGIQVCPERGPGVIQVKKRFLFDAKNWEGDPPIAVQIQLQHEMEVMGVQWGTICALLGTQDYVSFDIDRNDRFIEALKGELREFWTMVQAGTPPPVDGSDSTKRTLAKLHEDDNGGTVDLPSESATWDRELEYIKQQQSDLKSDRQDIENKLRAAIGDATFGLLPDGTQYSWRTQNRKAYSVEASKYRVLRRKE